MKKICILLLLMMSFVMSSATVVKVLRDVSKEEALATAQKKFKDQDVNYFIKQDNDNGSWTIFVDAEPMKGWEHDGYLLTIPKKVRWDFAMVPIENVEKLSLPPEGNFEILYIPERYPTNSNNRPVVSRSDSPVLSNSIANRTYALIISGGISLTSNYGRYWNDCSFIYQTLVNKYGIPKANIYPIMSDGDNPGLDMISGGGFVSQPLDLDHDGIADIKLAATKANISSTLDELNQKLSEGDHLFIYVIDHGGHDEAMQSSYICLWNKELLFPNQLASMLQPFAARNVNLNMVFGQCGSGGFVNQMNLKGAVISSACYADESSYASKERPYDIFVYHWTCAINGADHQGNPIDADIYKDGHITMEDAFKYAAEQDSIEMASRLCKEHPMYRSNPLSVGEDLAFDRLPIDVDIYLKDNPEDTGREPNLTTNEFWKSSSICIRNKNDGIFEHQAIVYSFVHKKAYIYVRVYNRGKKTYSGGKYLKMYWAQASTVLSPKAFRGYEMYNNHPIGGPLEAVAIPPIEPGDSTTVTVEWNLPDFLSDYPENNFHFCTIAKILDTPEDEVFVEGVTHFKIKDSNDETQSNVTIIPKKDKAIYYSVFVRNINPVLTDYTLEMVPQNQTDHVFYQKGSIDMRMSPKIFSAWETGGFKMQDMQLIPGDTNEPSDVDIRFLTPRSMIKAIRLNGNEFDTVKIRFSFNGYELTDTSYTFDLIQRDKQGNIVGGETFKVHAPTIVKDPIDVRPTSIGGGQYMLTVQNDNDFESFSWTDTRGNEISDCESAVVMPQFNNDSYTVVATTLNGDVATQTISLESKYGIKNIIRSESSNLYTVTLQAEAPEKASISVTSSLDPNINMTDIIEPGQTQISLDFSTMQKGFYILSYFVNNEIIDQKRIKHE